MRNKTSKPEVRSSSEGLRSLAVVEASFSHFRLSSLQEVLPGKGLLSRQMDRLGSEQPVWSTVCLLIEKTGGFNWMKGKRKVEAIR